MNISNGVVTTSVWWSKQIGTIGGPYRIDDEDGVSINSKPDTNYPWQVFMDYSDGTDAKPKWDRVIENSMDTHPGNRRNSSSHDDVDVNSIHMDRDFTLDELTPNGRTLNMLSSPLIPIN